MLWQEQQGTALPTIARVDSFDGDCFDVTLSNGHTIMLELGDRIEEPAFAKLIERKLFDRPQTDGKRLYWINGPSYTVEEIFTMLATRK